jgi:putative DNA-invertase from lambdoid prophage Rac
MNPSKQSDAGLIDGLYFRVSSNRQTTENQFADLLSIAEKDASERDWAEIRRLLSQVVYTEQKTGSRGLRTIYRIRPEIVARLADLAVYVEQGMSGKVGARRPLFERMKRDASLRRFDRLLVWKVSRLGRDMREVISTVYELSDLGITTVPIKSQTGPLNSSMGKLLWAVQAWFAEFENDERSENIKSGLKQALEDGKKLGRPRVDIDRSQVEALRASGASWRAIAAELGVGVGTVHRTLQRRSKIPCGAISLNQSDLNPATHILCRPANQ